MNTLYCLITQRYERVEEAFPITSAYGCLGLDKYKYMRELMRK